MGFVLKLKGITKRFGSPTANDRISLSVRRGTAHAIIGENGAGKSTLMNMINDLYRPGKGELFVHGKKVDFKNSNDASRAGTGMVYQEFMLLPELTVLSDIMMGYEKKKWDILLNREAARRHVKDIYREYHFNISLGELIQSLSVSTLQQVEIMEIPCRGVGIIIFDEPASVLTPQEIQGLFEAIRLLVKNGKTVLFITHKLKEVMEISDHITTLKNGHYVDTAKSDEMDEHGPATTVVEGGAILTVQKEEKKQGDVLLQVRHLSVPDYERREKLRDTSFEVRRGEILGTTGVVSSGQQELVEELFGLRSSSREGVLFDGRDVAGPNYRGYRMYHIGYVLQDRTSEGINRETTPWESAIMGHHIAKGLGNRYLLKQKQAISFIEHIVHDFNVKASSSNLKIQTPPGGSIQKLAVGREFLQDNRLLVIEDPTRGIGVDAIKFIWKKIEDLADTGTTTLPVSHELNEVMEVSDHILAMYDERLYDGGMHGEKTETEIGFLMMGGGCA